MNRFMGELAEICGQQLFAAKWILAPSLRTGHQWLEQIARSGQTVINAHIKTVRSLAVELAAPVIAEHGVTLASNSASLQLVDHVVQRRLIDGQLRYFHEYHNVRRLAEMADRAIGALRMADLDPTALTAGQFESELKARDLMAIAAGYLEELRAEQLVDIADVFELAAARLTEDPRALPTGCLVLLPSDLELTRRERNLVALLPEGSLREVACDGPATEESNSADHTDCSRLRWLLSPGLAPAPKEDGTVRFASAIGEINEVRNVLRTCVAQNVPLDQVELLYTDPDTYIELILEALWSTQAITSTDADDLPVTFAEGIPVRYSRPGRALMLWLTWIREDCCQSVLVKLIREGLVKLPSGEGLPGYGRLSAVLSGLPIGQGRDRFTTKIDGEIERLAREHSEMHTAQDEDELRQASLEAGIKRRLDALRILRDVTSDLLTVAPGIDAPAQEVITCAQRFLERHARTANKLDAFALEKLLQEIREIGQWLERDDRLTTLDVWSWLRDVPRRCRVMGSGPRPACLHVDGIYSGGHSGRPYTFVIGLDDGRLPGAGLQDPVLLDAERERLSADLPLASQQVERSFVEFVRLLARLRGTVTLSYCTRGLHEDRELFPSSALLAAYRLVFGDPHADQAALLGSAQPTSGFAPSDGKSALCPQEWWLWRLCGQTPIDRERELVEAKFPWLSDGARACSSRQSEQLTEFDGFVPEAGRDLDPAAATDQVVSASRLETAGRCPLAFYFQYGLGINPPEEYETDPDRWLNALDFGAMMHRVFEQFMAALIKRGELPNVEAHQDELTAVLDTQLAAHRDEIPPPSPVAYRRREKEARETAQTFLVEEARWCAEEGSRPQYLEVALGLAADGEGTTLDAADPIAVMLPEGESIRTRGRIDRIDQIGSGSIRTYAIWDYKTGSTRGYEPNDPFNKGRHLQPYLYATIVAHRLEQLDPGQSAVKSFGFFFPGRRGAGRRISWSREQLEPGSVLLSQLCEAIRKGAFLATNNSDDCKYCEYQAICGDVDEVALASHRKLENPSNQDLIPFKQLRCGNAQ